MAKRLSVSRVHGNSLSQTEPKEWEKDFVSSVQQSIRLQLGMSVERDVAEALYNQSSRAAGTPQVFRQGLDLMKEARNIFHQRTRQSRERKLLGRVIFLHLLQYMTKNGHASWWRDVENDWLKTVRQLCVVPGDYDWRRDKGLLFQAKHILKTSTRAIWLLCVR
jgi:hypothetical protein